MASLHARSLMFWWAPIFLITVMESSASASAAATRSILSKAYPALFVFGDSALDAGNRAIESNSSSYMTLRYPYGETFPGWPFGRYSDGHTLVDFLAEYMELPLLNPYLNDRANFDSGVNYAVACATALNASFLHSLIGISPKTNLTLDVQVAFHLAYKASVESNSSLNGSRTTIALMEGLYIIEMGGNDYMRAFDSKHSPSFVNSTLIPLVIRKIHNVVETLLDNGAKNFLFIPLSPLGCNGALLAQFDGVKDGDGCLEEYNLVFDLHGKHLHEEVAKLRASYPNASFLFMDYYGVYKRIFKEKENLGFKDAYNACCGAGEDYPYNFNSLDWCNINSVSICPNPSVYVSWDGMHFTDSFNFHIFNQTFITGSYLDTPYSSI